MNTNKPTRAELADALDALVADGSIELQPDGRYALTELAHAVNDAIEQP